MFYLVLFQFEVLIFKTEPHCVVQTGLELVAIPLSQSPEYKDYMMTGCGYLDSFVCVF